MREAGEACSVHRVARIMRENGLKAQISCKRRYIKGGKLANVAANVLDRNFNPDEPNQAWVSDITYVRTYEGFLYVATVLDLFSRRIVGWSMDKTMDRLSYSGTAYGSVGALTEERSTGAQRSGQPIRER